jgi:hypothetical protein
MEPKRPQNLPEYAELCLRALANSGLGEKISVGGAIGLMHYFEYRTTHDVDAWWMDGTTGEEKSQIVELLEETLQPFGNVQTRTWGEVVSVELSVEEKVVFSFQIAQRSTQLEAAQRSPWGEFLLDSFDDLVASKMVALIERGAPRDFRDIYMLCQEGVITPKACWRLWKRRQEMAKSDRSVERARLAIETHLARIERQRPLDQIGDEAARQAAKDVRTWFKLEFSEAVEG